MKDYIHPAPGDPAAGRPRSATLALARAVRADALPHYEPGNHARSLKAVWRRHIRPAYGISYRTFRKYMIIGA